MDNYRARGRHKSEAVLPNLEADIRSLVDAQAQADPKFQSTFLLLAQEFRQWASCAFDTEPDEWVPIDGALHPRDCHQGANGLPKLTRPEERFVDALEKAGANHLSDCQCLHRIK